MQIGKELAVDEIAEVVAGQRFVVVELAVLVLGRSPTFPAVWLVEDAGLFFAVERGFGGFVLFESGEIFQEQQPRGLFGVIQLRGATGFLVENVVNALEGAFEQAGERWNFSLARKSATSSFTRAKAASNPENMAG
jgi:hypothetical protein